MPPSRTLDYRGKVLLLGGPTATGKSALAIELALILQGEIVNADSLLFYRHLDIGTAKPTPQERSLVPHHLIDILEPSQEFDAYHYAQKAARIIQEIWQRGHLPIVVGGTGFYMKALYYGLPPQVGKDPGYREELLRAEEESPGTLYRRLQEIDPRAAGRIHPRDRVRLVRALEIHRVTEKPPSQVWQEVKKPLEADFFKVALYLPRRELYARINARVLEMVKKGLVEETERILAMGYHPELKPLQSIGYREAILYLQGKLSREEMVREIQKKTRNYAKRQITWFKKEGFQWYPPQVDKIIEKLEDGLKTPNKGAKKDQKEVIK